LQGVIDQGEAIEQDLFKSVNDVFDAIEKGYDSIDYMVGNATSSLKILYQTSQILSRT